MIFESPTSEGNPRGLALGALMGLLRQRLAVQGQSASCHRLGESEYSRQGLTRDSLPAVIGWGESEYSRQGLTREVCQLS